MHFEHAEALLEARQDKYRNAINSDRPVSIRTIADAIAMAGLLNAMIQGMTAVGIHADSREDFETPLKGYFG